MLRSFSLFMLTIFVSFFTTSVEAQDFVLTVDGPATGSLGASIDQSVIFDNNGDAVAGWSYGVCHDTALLTLTDVVDGATTATVNGGGAPDFNQVNSFAGGYTVGVVISFTGGASLPVSTGNELNVGTYTCDNEGTSVTSLCDTLGSPPVETVVVVNGASVVPVQNDGNTEIQGVPDPQYTITAPSDTVTFDGNTGVGAFTAAFSITEVDNSALGAPFPNETQGFSLGLGNDSTLLTPIAISDTLPFSADFGESNLLADGWTIGVVYSFTGATTLAFDAPLDVVSVDYDTVPGSLIGSVDNVETSLTWINTLGTPPVENVLVVNGGSIAPIFEDGAITLEPFSIPDPEFNFNAPSSTVNYDGNSGSASFSAAFSISEVDNSALGADFPNPSQGFSMGMGNDSAVLEPTAVTATLPFDADFAEGGIFPDGWTIGVVYSFTGGETLSFENALDVVLVEYSTVAGALSGPDATTTNLSWTGALGSPPVDNVVVVNGSSIEPTLNDGTLTLQPVFDIPFIRGNCNGDNKVNIADGIWILNELFLQGPSGTCFAACDANDDNRYDQADAIFIIAYRLQDGPMPAAPFPDCGPVAGANCDATTNCP
ncbi:MAG: hypothetical protein CBC13_08515 [Planctomycetia bacterium TMED53]|nr:MAG: hypothetical protein CBC13_08515 [Planctomycetia bacterium TMED53]